MAFQGGIYVPPGGSGNVLVKASLSYDQVAERTEEVIPVVASVYSNSKDIVKHTVEIMGQLEDLSLDSLKHIRHLCEV